MKIDKSMMILLFLFSVGFANNVTLDLFVMSKCPYGTTAETQIYNLISQHPELAEQIDVQIHYILDYDSESESFRSLHGQKEVDENIRQIIIMKYFPEKFWCYLSSRNSHFGDTLWESDVEICGINKKKLTKYIKKKGYTLAIDEAHLTDSLNIDASPTILINGIKIRDWMGDFPTLYTILNNSLVSKVSEMKCRSDVECPPKTGYITSCVDGKCQYRKAPLVTLTAIVPDTIKYGSSSFGLIRFLENEIGNIKTIYIPYGDEKSEEIISKLNDDIKPEFQAKSSHYSVSKGSEKPITEINSLPVYIISNSIKQYPAFKKFGSYMLPCRFDGDSIYIADPNTYPSGAILDRVEREGKIDIFVMAKCPFSKALEESLFVKNFVDLNIDNIKLHYVVKYNDTTGKFDAFHGRSEITESKRQIIIQKYFPEKFWDYIHCYNISANNDSCISITGLKSDEIGKLISKYSDTMLKNNAKLCKELNIHSTPTVMLNNRYILRNSNDIKKHFNILLDSGTCGH